MCGPLGASGPQEAMSGRCENLSEAKRPRELQPQGAFLLFLQCPQMYLVVPNSCAMGLDSGAHSPIFSMVWLKWGVVGDAIRPTLGPVTNLRMGRHCLSHPEGSSQQQVSPCQPQTQQPCNLDWE